MFAKKLLEIFEYICGLTCVLGIITICITDGIFGADYLGDFLVYYFIGIIVGFFIFIPLALIAMLIDTITLRPE